MPAQTESLVDVVAPGQLVGAGEGIIAVSPLHCVP